MTSLTCTQCTVYKKDLVIEVREDCWLQDDAYKGFQTDADWLVISTNQRLQNIHLKSYLNEDQFLEYSKSFEKVLVETDFKFEFFFNRFQFG